MNIDFINKNKKELFIQVTNDTGLEVVFCNVGASVYSLKLDGEDMILSYKDLSSFITNTTSYQGKTVGRISGRIKDGLFKVDDKLYQLDVNAEPFCLHGGSHSVSFVPWNYEINKSSKGIIISFYIKTKEKEFLFNGTCIYRVNYKIPRNDNNLIIEFDAVTNEATYYRMINHMYFNLGMAKDILDHTLTLPRIKYSQYGSTFLDMTFVDTEGSIFDFTKGKTISSIINEKELHNRDFLNGIDHSFIYYDTDYNVPALMLKGELYNMEVYTDCSGLVLYTDGFPSDLELTDGTKEEPYKGIAIEFCNLEPEYKKKKEHYTHKIKYVFKRNFE